MSKADAGIFLAHGPTLSEFLGHLGSQFDDSYFLSFVFLEVYFTTVISVENRKFFRSLMTKRTFPLKSSPEV